MRKNITLSILFFCIGFFVHALFFPDFLANGIFQSPPLLDSSKPAEKDLGDTQNQHFTTVTFDGNRFSRGNITIAKSDYIVIRNDSNDVQMWLTSDVKAFTTVRGLAYGEQLQFRFDESGTFQVSDTKNPQNRILITVK